MIRVVAIAALVLASMFMATAARADCDYNSPDQSPAPTPCNGPLRVVVTNDTDVPVAIHDAGDTVNDISGKLELAGGLVVFLGSVVAVRSFKRGGLPV